MPSLLKADESLLCRCHHRVGSIGLRIWWISKSCFTPKVLWQIRSWIRQKEPGFGSILLHGMVVIFYGDGAGCCSDVKGSKDHGRHI